MDRDQHVVQDAAEHYAVFRMQREAEKLGRAITNSSGDLEEAFLSYLRAGGISPEVFDKGTFRQYKDNADLQLPRFVERLALKFPDQRFEFHNVEKEFRNLGKKADFLIVSSASDSPIAVSLKNYIGQGGILRPQVAAGTFLSFALSFLFERVGVGSYQAPDDESRRFRGSSVPDRDHALCEIGCQDLIPLFHDLDALQSSMRDEFLGPECEIYDRERVALAAKRIAEPAIEIVLEVFRAIGAQRVRDVLLARVGFDGMEDVLFFDSTRYVDSITSPSFQSLKERLSDPGTWVQAVRNGQGIQFRFISGDEVLLTTDVPFTINTNGAWYRPREHFEGTQPYNDKGHIVELAWGQRRPYKSREIATSINTYVNLGATGVFD